MPNIWLQVQRSYLLMPFRWQWTLNISKAKQHGNDKIPCRIRHPSRKSHVLSRLCQQMMCHYLSEMFCAQNRLKMLISLHFYYIYIYIYSPRHKHWPAGPAHFSDRRTSSGQYILSVTGPYGPPRYMSGHQISNSAGPNDDNSQYVFFARSPVPHLGSFRAALLLQRNASVSRVRVGHVNQTHWRQCLDHANIRHASGHFSPRSTCHGSE